MKNRLWDFDSLPEIVVDERFASLVGDVVENPRSSEEVELIVKGISFDVISTKLAQIFKERNFTITECDELTGGYLPIYSLVLRPLDEARVHFEKGIRQPFGSSGGKHFLAKEIISYIPEHKIYAEPFAGGAAVFWAKEPSEVEVLNDKDPEIAFAFRFLQTFTKDELKQLERFDWISKRSLFEKFRDGKIKPKSRAERYYQFLYVIRASYGKNRQGYNPFYQGKSIKPDFSNYEIVKKRLQGVKIFNLDYSELLKRYDGEETFFYLDPPYPTEWANVLLLGFSEEDTKRLSEFLQNLRGKFILSFERNEKFRKYFQNFRLRNVRRRWYFLRPEQYCEQKERPFKSEWLISNFTLEKRNIYLAKAQSYIRVLGSQASLTSKHGAHFSLLIEHKAKRILIDPSVGKLENIDYIIVTQAERDHYARIKEYEGVPIYSTSAILDKIPISENIHPFLKPLRIDGLEIHPIKTTHKPGVPSIGIRCDFNDVRVSIIPEFIKLAEHEQDLIRETIWIVGVGDYERDDEQEGKLSFLSLLKLAEELKPKRVFLTNLREDIYKHRKEVEEALEYLKGRILEDESLLTISEVKKIAKHKSWGLCKPAYRIFEIDDLRQTPHFREGRAVIEAKWDGVRTKIIKRNGKVTIMTDPEETETPDKTKRLPHQVRELEAMKEDNFVLDSEITLLSEDGKEILHRTSVNALINGKFDPTEVAKRAHIYVFDILEFRGEDVKNFPLKERKELLSKFKDSEHVHFVRSYTDLRRESLSYVVDLENLGEVKRAIDRIMNYSRKGGAFPKHIAEGVMVKLLTEPYETPQNHSWVKWKERFEIDALVVGKHEIIREGKRTDNFNYELAVGPISEEWASAIQKKDKNAVIEFRGKFYNWIGKSDNTKINVSVGSILRIASEDINKFETDDPKYPYYKGYVNIVLQPVPEKDKPDSMLVLERLAEMTPRRESFVEKSVKDDLRVSIEQGEMPKEVYERYAKKNEPLPREFYVDYREGRAWMQTHIRGIEPDDVERYKKGELSLAQLFEKHSIHIDLRMNFGLKKLIQWVITDNDVESYFKMLKGERVETASGVKNVAKSMAIVKPSAQEPTAIKKAEEFKEPAISKRGAELLAEYQILDGSYIIQPGEVGTTPYKAAWMGLIWVGKVKAGIQRDDYHEYFFMPDERLKEKNKSLLNGQFVIRAFKREGGKGAYWQIWKSTEGMPADPVKHKDRGHYYPIPANKLKHIGREHYEYGKKRS
jgi:DNA adenine methylase